MAPWAASVVQRDRSRVTVPSSRLFPQYFNSVSWPCFLPQSSTAAVHVGSCNGCDQNQGFED